MAFPPPNKSGGPMPPRKPGAGGPPNVPGPPGMGGPMDAALPPPGAAPLGPPAGMPRPGQGMDPMMAMLNGLGPMAPPMAPPTPELPLGPNGMPIGGRLPGPGDPDMAGDMDGSALLQALVGDLESPGMIPGGDTDLEGIGTGDPKMGLEQLLALMALSQAGVGGGPPTGMPGGGGPIGGSGVDIPPLGGMGQMMGF